MTYLSPIVKNRLEAKLAKLNKLRPLPKSAVQKLREKFQIEMTYNSNAIEGNFLTSKEAVERYIKNRTSQRKFQNKKVVFSASLRKRFI